MVYLGVAYFVPLYCLVDPSMRVSPSLSLHSIVLFPLQWFPQNWYVFRASIITFVEMKSKCPFVIFLSYYILLHYRTSLTVVILISNYLNVNVLSSKLTPSDFLQSFHCLTPTSSPKFNCFFLHTVSSMNLHSHNDQSNQCFLLTQTYSDWSPWF